MGPITASTALGPAAYTKSIPSSPRTLTSANCPVDMLSLIRFPRLVAAAAMAATRFGSAPLESECATGRPSLEASNTPRSSGIEFRKFSRWFFKTSCFTIKLSPCLRQYNRYASECRLVVLWPASQYDRLIGTKL